MTAYTVVAEARSSLGVPVYTRGRGMTQERHTFVVVSVTDENHAPVSGLSKGNFLLLELAGVSVVSKLDVSFFIEATAHSEGRPGFYILKVKSGLEASEGIKVIGVIVQKIGRIAKPGRRPAPKYPETYGQTLTTVTIE